MMTYTDFILSLQEMFLSEQEFSLANSSGIPFDMDSVDRTLQEFVKAHEPPSKLKIILLHFPVSMHVNRAVILYYYLVVSFIRMTLNLMMRKLIVLQKEEHGKGELKLSTVILLIIRIMFIKFQLM